MQHQKGQHSNQSRAIGQATEPTPIECDVETISLRPMGGRRTMPTAAAATTVAPPELAPACANDGDADRHPLHRRWQWWVHRPCYDGSSYAGTWEPMAKTPVGTIESFWRHQNNLPAASALFGTNRERIRDGAASAIEGISFFDANVLPEWEHVRNAMGASVVFKGAFGPRQADAVWERVVLALVGEQTGDDSDRITGARLVDRVSSMRVEVWLDDDDDALADRVGRWFMTHAFEGVVAPGAVRDFFVSKHVQAKTAKGEGYRAAITPHARRAPTGPRGRRRGDGGTC
ncbi:Eukaryotic translation initiation factor 4E [Pandoravirus quercus]|uniref:Eukaryotic translation initiation factor 4E n=3 Tax=Pandoravirus TaxID=2060084 RepID=A0A2U7U8E2_9VIRU|nr:Eukaryotic translation initiation factor 4E [Pandoravirus quercus]AVK74718.1 Eukaryotic translation initiation factor 4E [Pandoravirus quercus]QBZ80894.1 Eukaryotic initiation factor 4E domain containing protein [Pandoravirus celtis]